MGLTSGAPVVERGKLTVLFFDVGEGDAIFIATPGEKYYLIDAGGISGNGASIAERAIVPLLDAERLAPVSAGFATHMHLDHYGGFVHLVEHGEVDTVYSCGGKTDVLAARSLDSITFIRHVPVAALHQGDVLQLDDDVLAYVINPDLHSEEERNERSLVLKVVYGNTALLLLADVTAKTEETLTARYGPFLKSDLVKVAHHGSRMSSSPKLVELTRAQYAVFSCGRRNRHGHPNPEVVERWRQSGATTARTDLEGTVLFSSDGNHIERRDWR